MSCKSALYAHNSASQTITDGNINFGSIVRRFGNNINLSGGNVVLNGVGYYDIDANFNLTATGALTTITLYKDGVAIPGAVTTHTTTSGNVYSLTIPTMVRETCCCESVITARINGGTITNASIVVTKL